MSDDKDLIHSILDSSSKDINYYNNYIDKLFTDLSWRKAKKIHQEKEEQIIKNIKNNINKLVNHIKELKGDNDENKDLYNCLSCIYGAFLGDALGAYCEFSSANPDNHKRILQGNPMFGDSPGQVTDDSEMAMCCAFGIMDNPYMLRLDSDYLYYYYGCWYLSNPKDIGYTTRSALRFFKTTDFDPNKKNNFQNIFKTIRNSNYNSMANGFLMRTSPFIAWCYYRFKELIEETFQSLKKEKLFELFQIIKIQAKKDDICTHPNDKLCISHSCFSIMALAAICGKKAKEILEILENLLTNEFFDTLEAKDIKQMIMDEINEHKNNKNGKGYKIPQENYGFLYFSQIKSVNNHMGFYVHAFRLTLYYLAYFDEIEETNNFTKYRIIMNQICNYGGDTDTNAAIVGTVIGPLIGLKNFGDELWTRV